MQLGSVSRWQGIMNQELLKLIPVLVIVWSVLT